jgi:hypothetical protein
MCFHSYTNNSHTDPRSNPAVDQSGMIVTSGATSTATAGEQEDVLECAYCGERILDSCVDACGQAWHPHHFFCRCCGLVLGDGVVFLERDGVAYCEGLSLFIYFLIQSLMSLKIDYLYAQWIIINFLQHFVLAVPTLLRANMFRP